jgi:hypothetical protein
MAQRASSVAQSPADSRLVAAAERGAPWAAGIALGRALAVLAAVGLVLLSVAAMSYILFQLAAWWVEIPNAYPTYSTRWRY